jgi:hypothetical protein
MPLPRLLPNIGRVGSIIEPTSALEFEPVDAVELGAQN